MTHRMARRHRDSRDARWWSCRALLLAAIAAAAAVTTACGEDGPGTGEFETPTPTATVTRDRPPLPEKWTADETHAGRDWGFTGCHGMRTKASVYSATGKVFAWTDIWSRCELGGFTGTAGVILADSSDVTIADALAPETWDVVGKIEAATLGKKNERHNLGWRAMVPTDDLEVVDHVRVFHSWAPRDRLADIVRDGIARGQRAAEIISMISAIPAPSAPAQSRPLTP
jgi:hypothetical protein